MENNYRNLSFKGIGIDLLLIYLKNIFFTLLTLGIYSFWARVNVTRYLYNNTRYQDEPFDYHATGMERFIGFLKAAGILILFYIVIMLLAMASTAFFGEKAAAIIIPVFVYIVILAAIPFIIVGRERFRQSRSSWKSIRFRFNGTPRELAIVFFKGVGLTIVTLGVYAPWYYCSMQRYFLTHSHFGGQAFDFNGTGKMLAKPFFIGLLLTVITLGIYGFWLQAMLKRFVWNNTTIQGKRFSSTITGGRIFSTTLLSLLLVVVTLGFGIPWAVIMYMRLFIDTIGIEEGIDFSAIKSDFDAKASALSDGLSQAADAMDSIGGMFS